MRRHDRQARLAEVGPAGQTRIERATVTLGEGGFAGDVAVRYLAGAGVGVLRVADASLATVARSIDPTLDVRVGTAQRAIRAAPSEGPPSDARAVDAGAVPLRDPAAQALARGALLALGCLRRALGES